MTNEQFLQQFGHFIDASNGIQKLREMILQLAVQGKLVEQDMSDEPAQELLETISFKKSELVKQKAIKKEKKLPTPNDDEIPFQLPYSWSWTRLGHVTNYGSTDKAEANDVSDETWVLELEDVEKITSRLLKITTFDERQFKSSKNRFEVGDVIYGKLRPYLDKVLVADKEGVCTTEMIPIRGYHGITPEYLRWYLKSPYFIQYADSSTHGMNLPRMGTDKGRMSLFPLPPLAEQHRIVAKVDELMALCDQLEAERNAREATHQRLIRAVHHPLTEAADANATQTAWHRIRDNFADLYTTLESVQALRQTILQLAVQGKLVEQDDKDESASELLRSIDNEKEALIKSKEIKAGKNLPSIEEGDDVFTIPSSWTWVRLGRPLLDSEAGWSPKAENTPASGESWGVLKVSAVSWGEFKPLENKALTPSTEPRTQYEVKPGDFLISRANTAELVARSVVVEETPPRLMMSDKIIRLKFSDKVYSRYINLFNASAFARAYYAKVAGGTSSSMKNVSRQQIACLPIALPPLREQHRIVTKVDELMALCDQLEANIRDKNDTATRYAEAIVQQIAAA